MRKFFVLLIILFPLSSYPFERVAEYDISSYSAVFEPVADTGNVKVTLNIEYHVTSGVKSGGFKFIGICDVTEISAEDGYGNPVQVMHSGLEENKLEWFFDGTAAGNSRTIIVRFVLNDCLQKQEALYTFKAYWAGVFRANVKNAEYRFIFPGSEKPVIEACSQADYSVEKNSGKWELIIVQSPLTRHDFIVSYGAQNQQIGDAGITGDNDKSTWSTWLVKIYYNHFEWLLMLIAVVIAIIKNKYSDNKKGSDGGRYRGKGGSGCSGCGSGCGGGCGGCGD
ncbi:MAG TPA: hypothetical protein PK514_11745 [Spirochaetota bacterium]|nr:hypothetical protein [Spirochaetota bacterium]